MSSLLPKRIFKIFGGWGSHIYFITKDKKFKSCGSNDYGQLGVGDRTTRFSPDDVQLPQRGFFEPSSVANGKLHSLILSTRGIAYSCGSHSEGQCGTNDFDNPIISPALVKFGRIDLRGKIRQVATGGHSSYVLSTDGDIFSFGSNANYQLGLGDSSNRWFGVRIRKLKPKIEEMIAGFNFAIAISREKNIYVWGSNSKGQLGFGHTQGENKIPVEMKWFKDNLIGLRRISVSSETVYYLTDQHKVYAVGRNENTELGNGKIQNSSKPVLLTSMRSVVDIRGGTQYAIYRTNDLSVYGVGCLVDGCYPVEFHSLSDKRITQMVCLESSVIFIGSDTSMYAFGSNLTGQLMNGMKDDSNNPKEVIQTHDRFDVMRDENVVDDYVGVTKEINDYSRLDYVTHELEKDVTVSFSDGQVKSFKSMLAGSPSSKNIKNGLLEIFSNSVMPIDEEIVTSMFFGNEKGLFSDLKNFFMLFLFTSKVCLKQHEYLVLKKIADLDLVSWIKLFSVSYKALEKQPEEKMTDEFNFDSVFNDVPETKEIYLESIFNRHLFNLISTRKEEIEKSPVLLRVFVKNLKLFDDLVRYKPRPIEQSEYFKGEIPSEKSFKELYDKQLQALYNLRETTSNLIIVSRDKKETPVHREIVMNESDYLFQVLKFPGIENRKEGYLILETLEIEEVTLLVQYIYFKEVTVGVLVPTPDFFFARINLLVQIVQYNEVDLQNLLISEIFDITREMGADKFIEKVFPTVGILFHPSVKGLPQKIADLLLTEWGKLFTPRKLLEREVLRIFQENSEKVSRECEKSELEGKIKALTERVEELERENVELMRKSVK